MGQEKDNILYLAAIGDDDHYIVRADTFEGDMIASAPTLREGLDKVLARYLQAVELLGGGGVRVLYQGHVLTKNLVCQEQDD